MSHEYGTRGVALIDGQGELHWKPTTSGRILNLEDVIELFETAWMKFHEQLLSDDPAVRDRVLPRSKGLLAPVEVEIGHPADAPVLTIMPSLSASEAWIASAHSVSASPTGPITKQ